MASNGRAIPPEAVELFRRADPLYDRYRACAMGGPCDAPSRHQHCDDCSTYLRSTEQLTLLLGLGPWDICPTDVEAEAPDDPAQFERWRTAYDLRGKLLAAIAPRRRATSRRSRR
jgi:hypothetical protein